MNEEVWVRYYYKEELATPQVDTLGLWAGLLDAYLILLDDPRQVNRTAFSLFLMLASVTQAVQVKSKVVEKCYTIYLIAYES